TMGIVSALYAGFYSWWWKEELDQDSLEKSIQKTLPIAREMAIKTFKAMGDHTIYIISSASARYNIQEVLLSGHSLGGNGVLSSIQRLKQETEQGKIKFNLNCIKGYMFNSPGGLLGCNVMANNLSEEDKAYIMDVLLGRKAAANDLSKKDRYSIPIYQIFRKSCIVGSNAKFTGFNINSIELSPYTKTEDKSFTHWCKTIVDEHSISILKKEIVEEYERCRQDRK
ncbi:MAG: hypothetical protein KC505_00300, partial [Myxococcales bacterium]|nr:hypothetical protein [Myxococcales bacterium]